MKICGVVEEAISCCGVREISWFVFEDREGYGSEPPIDANITSPTGLLVGYFVKGHKESAAALKELKKHYSILYRSRPRTSVSKHASEEAQTHGIYMVVFNVPKG